MRWARSQARAISVCVVVFALSSAAAAQDPAPHSHTPALLHESYYNVPLLDLIPGGRLFRAHAVPVLQEMVEAGSVYAWYEAEMPIGNASNLYLAVVLRDSLALAEFRQLLPRVAQRAGAAGDTLARLMTPEREELWEIVSIRMPSPAAEATWLQHRMFEVSTAQPDDWRGLLDEMTTPVRERSMDGGVLDGWIELRRRDGNRHSWKFLEWYGGWEDIDEFGESFFAGLAADVQRATVWARAVERMRLEIWRYLPRNSRALPAERGEGAADERLPGGVEQAAIADTIRQFARSVGDQVDAGDCEGAAGHIGAGFVLVSGGRINEMRTREAMIAGCRRMNEPRRSARNDVQSDTVHVLGPHSAYYMSRSIYTIHWANGDSTVTPMATTGIWSRQPDGWRLVHLPESWPETAPEG